MTTLPVDWIHIGTQNEVPQYTQLTAIYHTYKLSSNHKHPINALQRSAMNLFSLAQDERDAHSLPAVRFELVELSGVQVSKRRLLDIAPIASHIRRQWRRALSDATHAACVHCAGGASARQVGGQWHCGRRAVLLRCSRPDACRQEANA